MRANPPAETSLHSLASTTKLQTARLLRRWSREPAVLIQSLVFPAFLLVVFQWVLGRTITLFSGSDSIYGQVPLIALLAGMFGTLTTGIALTAERDAGLLARFWVLPVHRASGLASRLLGEMVRTLASTVVMLGIGYLLGFRFQQGGWAAVGFVLIPVLLITGFATMVIAVAVVSSGKTVLELMSTVCLLMLFFNSGFVPTDEYPGWLQPVVRVQPMSPAIEAMRGLSEGGPVAVPVLQTLAWTVGLVAVFGWLAVRGYRRAAAE
ncbi:MAG TPA: ABC transporter permease [Aldersonia sp.]